MAATARAVDLTNVKEGANFRPRRKPEGDYKAKIVKADDHQPSNKDKGPGWVLTIQVEGDSRSTYPFYLNPAEKEAWKIGAICRAAGLKVPKGRMRFDPNKLINRAIGVYLADDEYEGRVKSTIDDVFPVSEVGPNADEDIPEDEVDVGDEDETYDEGIPEDEDEDEEEEAPAPPPRKRTRAKPVPVEEPEDEEEEEDEEPSPPPRKRARKPAPPPVDEDEDEADEDDEEEPAPPPRRRATPPPAKKAASPTRRRKPAPPPEDDEDDLDELDTDDLD